MRVKKTEEDGGVKERGDVFEGARHPSDRCEREMSLHRTTHREVSPESLPHERPGIYA